MLYKVLIDEVEPQQWRESAEKFSDYSIYQTWSYQEVRANEEGQQISRILIKDDEDEIVMMSHVRIKHVAPLGLKVGYIQWGPLIMKKDGTCRCTVEALKSLREAYLGTRVNVLRIVPNIVDNAANQKYVEMFAASGFHHRKNILPYRTIVLGLNGSEETLRKGLHKSWRKNLHRSQRNALKIREGNDDSFYKEFMHLYKEMHTRKKFVESVDIHQFRQVQKDLPEAQKMNISLCLFNDEPVAALVWSAIGDVGITILSATGDKGLKNYSSYLLMWELFKRLKECNCRFLDQGGIDPERNPGGYMFKAGMGGAEQFHIGTFEAYANSVVRSAFRVGEKIYKGVKILGK